MRTFLHCSIILIILILLIIGNSAVSAFDGVFGIKIEQRALDVLRLASQRLTYVLGSQDLQQVLSVKAKIIISDVIETGDILDQSSQMILNARIEIFKADPDMVRVNFATSFGDLQFIVTDSGAVAVLPEDGVYADTNIPELLPANLTLPDDDGGLFTLINMLGGIPLGSLFREPSAGAVVPGSDIGFVEELDPADLRATIRYRGEDKTEAGAVHVVNVLTAGASPNRQSIKIWILKDTMDFYQLSIEDERGTEVFVVIDEVDISPVLPEETFIMDTSDLVAITEEELLVRFMLKIAATPTMENPMALDLYASTDRVARTGSIIISSDGFDLEDREDKLKFEAEYMSPGGPWLPLDETEYAGLAPLGHWDAVFAPDSTAELGMYSFRARYIDSSGNPSEWLESLDLVTVTPEPPRVVKTKPVSNEKDVSVSTDISVTFSKPMNRETVEKVFSLISIRGRIIRGSFAWDENTLIFTPSGNLEYDTFYRVRITGQAKDMDDMGLDGNFDNASDGLSYDDYIWNFTTSPAPPALTYVIPDKAVYKGDSFNVEIMARYVKNMHKFSFRIAFDPELLEVKKVDKASFSSWKPRPKSIEGADLWVKTGIDNSAGIITITCNGTRADGVSGTGRIATISFKAVEVGTAMLEFADVSVVDSRDRPINAELKTAEIQIIDYHPLDVNRDGVVNILDFAATASEEESTKAAPYSAQYTLEQNYPNPFNPETWIPYQLAQPSQVTIRIYRSTGELVQTLDLGYKEAGFYTDRMKSAYWDGTDNTGEKVSSGIYFYTIQASGFTATKKMLLCQ